MQTVVLFHLNLDKNYVLVFLHILLSFEVFNSSLVKCYRMLTEGVIGRIMFRRAQG